MPIYEYTCRKCKAHVEIIQKMTDKPLTRCRKCGGRLEKEWSTSGIQFKGAGWYVTDYAGRKTDAKEAQGEAKTEAKAEAKTEPKADAKAESKADGKSENKPEGKARGAAQKTARNATTSGD
ncbi:MAG TPA: FmdB family zinc ribbon protein [Pyrinomonadaceae bacterium]|jgi:putative FmdB family regulatory protein